MRRECKRSAEKMHMLNNEFRFSGNGIGRALLSNSILSVENDDVILCDVESNRWKRTSDETYFINDDFLSSTALLIYIFYSVPVGCHVLKMDLFKAWARLRYIVLYANRCDFLWAFFFDFYERVLCVYSRTNIIRHFTVGRVSIE